MLSDPLDSLEADGQQMLTGNIHDANDIISKAVENLQANGSNGAEVGTEYNGHVFNGQSSENQRAQRQRQRHINKSRKNNKAMTNPKFLRKRTEALLNASGSHGTLKVDKKTFDWLLDAWAYSGESDAVDNALALLARMEELRETDASVAPNVKSITRRSTPSPALDGETPEKEPRSY